MSAEDPEFPQEEMSYPEAALLELWPCLLAALHGKDSKSASIAELRNLLLSVGKKASVPVVSLALGDLQARLEEDSLSPFRMEQAGTEWRLVAKSEALDALAGNGCIRLDAPLSEEELFVLAAVIFKNGITLSALEKLIGSAAKPALEVLHRKDLIYAEPGRFFTYWRPSRETLKRFRLRRFSDIPGYVEYNEFLKGKRPAQATIERADAELKKAVKSKKWRPGGSSVTR